MSDNYTDGQMETGGEEKRPIIDCLGITVKLAELESWDEYEPLRRKMHSGFTATWLYRLLFSRRYRRLYRAYIDAQLKVQQEFLGKVLELSEAR